MCRQIVQTLEARHQNVYAERQTLRQDHDRQRVLYERCTVFLSWVVFGNPRAEGMLMFTICHTDSSE